MKTRMQKKARYAIGYSLLELIIVLTVLTVFLGMAVRPVRDLSTSVPRSSKMFRTWSRTMKVLEQLKKDVEHCEIIEPTGGGGFTLTARHSEIHYLVENGRMVRTDVSAGQSRTSELEDVKIQIDFWSNEDGTYAVAIKTWSLRNDPYSKRDRQEKEAKLGQSFVYFKKGHLQ